MAKGIEINGMLRGKRGGVVYSRQNGQQISRARNFAPKNPKTDGQLIQRAITATIAQMYSAGKAIFDHSFEGQSVPAGSMRAFLKENMKRLRAAILNDMAKDTDVVEESSLRNYVVSPLADAPVPGAYMISKGSYKNAAFDISSSTGSAIVRFDATGQTYAAALESLNLVPGDIVTIVCLASKPSDFSRVSAPDTKFTFVRLIAKDVADPTAALPENAKLSDLFTIEAQVGTDPSFVSSISNLALTTGELVIQTPYVDGEYIVSSVGIITSRDDLKVRSTSFMKVINAPASAVPGNWSVTAFSLLESWKFAGNKTQSELILEGGSF